MAKKTPPKGKKPAPKVAPEAEEVPFSKSDAFRKANANRKTPMGGPANNPPPISDKILEQIAKENAGEPPPFRGSPKLNSINTGGFPPGYEPPFEAPRPNGPGLGGPAAMALGMALEPTPIADTRPQENLIGKIGQQSSVLGGAPSPEEINSMIAQSMAPPSPAPDMEIYNAMVPQHKGVGGGILPAAMVNSSPKDAYPAQPVNYSAPQAPAAPANPYFQGAAQKGGVMRTGIVNDDEQKMMDRIMLEQMQKGVR